MRVPAALPAALAAEWSFVRRRVLRTRLGVWLAALSAGTAALAGTAHAPLSVPVARLGLLAGLIGVAFTAASEADGAVMRLVLSHPASPAALLAGRAAAVLALTAAVLAVCLAAAAPARGAAWSAVVAAWVGGLGAAAAGIGAGLAAAALGGTGLVGALLAYCALVSPLPPEIWRDLVRAAPARILGGALLEWLPASWRYRALSGAAPLAWLHAAAWAGGGVAFAAWRLARRLR